MLLSDPLVLGPVARGLGAIVSLLALGLPYGFSPPLYGVTLHILARNPRPLSSIVYLMTGMALSAAMLLLAFRTFDPTTLAREFSGEIARLLVQTVVDLVVGGLLIVVGLILVLRLRTPRPKASTPGRAQAREGHPTAMIGVGFANTAIGVAPPVTMYVTGRVIGGATSHLTLQLAAFVVFLAAVIAPYAAATYLWKRLPALSSRVARGWARLARADLRPLVAWGLVAAGVLFLTLGIVAAVDS